jgi:peptidoglycan/LPS O-acetylase OafA/YrhL
MRRGAASTTLRHFGLTSCARVNGRSVHFSQWGASNPDMSERSNNVTELIICDGDRPVQKVADIQKLRAFAILMVLFGHTGLPLPDAVIHGYTGVTLFFVISGYVVTLTIIASTSASFPQGGVVAHLRNFYLRRIFRIMPALLFWTLFIIVTIELLNRLGATLVWDVNAWPREVRWMLSGLYNYHFAASHRGAIFGHFWSLAVEMHFYLFLPVLLLLLRKQAQRIVVCIAGVLLISTVLRRMTNPSEISFLTHTQADGLLMGVLVCIFYSGAHRLSRPAFRRHIRVPQIAKNIVFVGLTTVLFVLPSFVDGVWSPAAKYPFYVLLASVIVLLAQRDTGWVLGGMPRLEKFLAFVGDRSYSLYVCHPILWLGVYSFIFSKYSNSLPPWLGTSAFGLTLQVAVMFAFALFVADLSYRFIELPYLAHGKSTVRGLSTRSGPATRPESNSDGVLFTERK